MECVTYDNITAYLDTRVEMVDKLKTVCQIETQILNRMLDAATNPQVLVQSFELDDGQARLKSTFKSVTELANFLNVIQKVKINYENALQGSFTTLRNVNTFRNGWNWGWL